MCDGYMKRQNIGYITAMLEKHQFWHYTITQYSGKEGCGWDLSECFATR